MAFAYVLLLLEPNFTSKDRDRVSHWWGERRERGSRAGIAVVLWDLN